MLTPLARRPDVQWFCCVSEPPDAQRTHPGLLTMAADQADPDLHVTPVAVPAETYHAYYGQIANEVLWMLQHGVLGPGGYDRVDATRYRAWAEGYLQVNQRLAETITASCSSVEAFLIQDYHLYPLPELLRRSFPETPIVHFTHIPFPDPAVLKLLPSSWRKEVLGGLLGADIVGLQTSSDVGAFLACCSEFLHSEVDLERSVVKAEDGRWVRVQAYPASVDPEELKRRVRSVSVEAGRQRLRGGRDELNLVRVDRLDPSKNQLAGFQSFGRLLELRPDLRARVRFSAFLIPSRTDLGVYRAYRDAVYGEIDRINERFGRECGGPPIRVFYTNDRDQALAAMESCDVLLINSWQDGMNLVAKEWALVSRRPGVLVLSETTGVAADAADTALLVSPLDVEGTAQALAKALEMAPSERRARLARFRQRVLRWTARDWLLNQLKDAGLPPSRLRFS